MTHDIQDLLDLILQLEERVIRLENGSLDPGNSGTDDSWYWNHG